MANSGYPDQTAPLGESDLGLHCLPRPVVQKLRIITVLVSKIPSNQILLRQTHPKNHKKVSFNHLHV